jgi:predicted DNA-binding transcriptional regulator YafY
VEILEGTYESPKDFTADDHLVEAWNLGEGDPVVATVRFAADLRWWVEQNMPEMKAGEGPGGSIEIEIPATDLDALVSWALPFGDSAEIVGPPEARDRVLEHLAPYLESR